MQRGELSRNGAGESIEESIQRLCSPFWVYILLCCNGSDGYRQLVYLWILQVELLGLEVRDEDVDVWYEVAPGRSILEAVCRSRCAGRGG